MRESGAVSLTENGCEEMRSGALAAQGYTVVVYVGERGRMGSLLEGLTPPRFVAVAELSERSLWKVKNSVVPEIRRAESQRHHGRHSALDIFGALGCGMFSSVDDCSCRMSNVCENCQRVPAAGRTFVVAHSFEGVQPFGPDHWWNGITCAVDAGDMEAGAEDRWLRPVHVPSVAVGTFPMGDMHWFGTQPRE